MKDLKELLKKLTIFDYAAFILIVIILTVSFLFFYRKTEYINIRVKVASPIYIYPVFGWADPYPSGWYAQNFKAGDVERDNLGRVTTEIRGVDTFNISATKKAVYLDLKVKATYDSRSKSFSTRGKKLVFGTQLRFDLSGITFEGFVVDFPGSELQENVKIYEKTVEAIVRGVPETYPSVPPQILEAIKVGDTIKSSSGQTLVKVEKVQLTPALRITTDYAGKVYQRTDPYYKDMTITMTVKVRELGTEMYIYDDFPLRVGLDIPFIFNDKALQAVIISIKDIR